MTHSTDTGMIEECGRVVAMQADAVWVTTLTRSGCGRCDQPGGCGQTSVFQLFGRREHRVLARLADDMQPGLQAGDGVVIAMPEGRVMRASLVMYLCPLLGLLAGAVLGQSLPGGGETASIFAGLAGLAAGFGLARFWSQRYLNQADWLPVVVRRLPSAPEVVHPV